MSASASSISRTLIGFGDLLRADPAIKARHRHQPDGGFEEHARRMMDFAQKRADQEDKGE
jgi:hypothetical protein